MKRILFFPLVFSIVPLIFPVPPLLGVICGLFQAFYLPGMVFLLYIGAGPVSPLDMVFFAPVLSPLVLTLLVCAAYAATGSVHTATVLSLGVLYLLLVASPFAVRRRGEAGGRPPAGIVLVAAGFLALFIATYLVNDYLFAYDMVRHSSIANEILYRGIPPLEPFFPDMPIQSNWIAYVFMAAWKSLSGLSMIHAMWVFGCFSIFVFPYLIARLTLHFTDRRSYALAVPIFSIAGLGVVGWITWPLNLARALVGRAHRAAEIGNIISQVELNGQGVVRFLAPIGSFAINLLEKYLIIDVQHYALNLFLLFMIVVLSEGFQRSSHWRAALTAFTIMIGVFLFHVFTGIVLLIAAILSGAVSLVRERMKREEKRHVFHVVTIPCCAAAAAAICLYYFATFRGVHADGVFVPDRIAFNVYNIVTIVIPLVVLLPFSWRALRDIFRADDRHNAIIGTWIVSFFIVCIAVDIRGTLESMAVFPLMLLLSVPVAKRIIDALVASSAPRRGILALWITVLFLVPAVLTTRGLMLEKPERAHHIRRYRITGNERGIYEWIRDNTDIEAVIVERNEYNVMPYYAFRRNFCMTSWEIRNYGYRGEKVERYREIRDELYSNDPIDRRTIALLESFDFDLYVVVWKEDIDYNTALKTRFDAYPEWFTAVYENPDGTVYRLRRE